jgi:hypothetical protein
MAKHTPVHYFLADKIITTLASGTHRQTAQERLNNDVIELMHIEENSFQLHGEIFISDCSIYDDLTPSAIKLVIRIQKELKMNNPLWECADRSKRDVRAALALLKRKDIISPIEGTDIFYVNVTKIRKGKPLSALGALYMVCKKQWELDKSWRPTTKDIRRLSAKENVNLQTVINSPFASESSPSTQAQYLSEHSLDL